MGKTKTAFVSEAPTDDKLSGKAAYEAKRKKREAEEAKKENRQLAEKKGKGSVKGVGLKGGERVKVVGGDMPVAETKEESTEAQSKTKQRQPKVRGKKYKEALAKVDRSKLYSIENAVKLIKDTSVTKFNGTVELHLVVKKEGLSVSVNLPNTTGKSKLIEIASEKTIEKLKNGEVDFDVLLATPDMMPKLVPFARLLGPKGLMPNPKTGTLIKSRADAKKYSADSVVIKTERKAPLIHTIAGKVDQKNSELVENIEAILSAVNKRQIVKATLTSTMGPGVKLEL